MPPGIMTWAKRDRAAFPCCPAWRGQPDSSTAHIPHPSPALRLWVGTGPKKGVRDHELGPSGWTQKEVEARDRRNGSRGGYGMGAPSEECLG